MLPRLNGTRGGFCGTYSRGCYSDVRDARLCREFVQEGQGGGGLLNYKGLHGQGKLINAEINKLFWPPSSCAALGEVLSLNLLSTAAAAPGFQILILSLHSSSSAAVVSKYKNKCIKERQILSQIGRR